MLRGNHPVRPPVANALRLEDAGSKPVKELVDDGLQRTVAAGLDLDPEGFALFLCKLRYCGTAFRKGFEPRIVNSGMIECGKVVFDLLKIDQLADCFGRRQARQRLDLFRSAAKARAFEQVRREVIVPVGPRDGSQVVLPGARSGRLCKSSWNEGILVPDAADCRAI